MNDYLDSIQRYIPLQINWTTGLLCICTATVCGIIHVYLCFDNMIKRNNLHEMNKKNNQMKQQEEEKVDLIQELKDMIHTNQLECLDREKRLREDIIKKNNDLRIILVGLMACNEGGPRKIRYPPNTYQEQIYLKDMDYLVAQRKEHESEFNWQQYNWQTGAR